VGMHRASDITIVLADLPGTSRRAVAGLIAATPGLALAGQASTLAELRAAVRDGRPDVVLLDDRLLRGGAWRTAAVGAPMVVTGVDDDPAYAARARRIGAAAWVAKDHVDDLLDALRAAVPRALAATG
jgi:DNA-binding NarL/FixJ family response regulator